MAIIIENQEGSKLALFQNVTKKDGKSVLVPFIFPSERKTLPPIDGNFFFTRVPLTEVSQPNAIISTKPEPAREMVPTEEAFGKGLTGYDIQQSSNGNEGTVNGIPIGETPVEDGGISFKMESIIPNPTV